MTYSKNRNKKRKAFSLLEIIVSLAIMGVSMIIMMNFLILSLQISVLSLARSFVREEVSNISGQITRDIRNADLILDCGGTGNSSYCKFVEAGKTYTWAPCASNAKRICKTQTVNATTSTIVYTSSNSVNIDIMTFSKGFTDSTSNSKTNILLLLNASHPNAGYKISNIIKQTAVSTRNY